MKINLLLLILFVGISSMAEIINAGIGGENTDKILARFQKDALKRKPDLVILMAGTNDTVNSYAALPPTKYKQNLLKLVSLSQKKGIKIILVEIPPAYEKYLRKRHKKTFFDKKSASERIKVSNKILADVAKAKKIPLVKIHDLFLPVTEKKGCLIRNKSNCKVEDGIHPTPAGYKVIAKAIYDTIIKNKIPHKKIVCIGDSITYGIHVKGAGTSFGECYPGILNKLFGMKR